jgi:Fe-S cluster assembly scaffold protein SufB
MSNSDRKRFFFGQNSDRQKFIVSHSHNAVSSRSGVIRRTVLDDSALSDFYGEINRADFAENSDAKQNNNNILLSDMAKAVPIEIFSMIM